MNPGAFRVRLLFTSGFAVIFLMAACSAAEPPNFTPLVATFQTATVSPEPVETATPTPRKIDLEEPTTAATATAFPFPTPTPSPTAAISSPLKPSPRHVVATNTAEHPKVTPTTTATSVASAGEANAPIFIDNDDCQTNISRSALPTKEVFISNKDVSVKVLVEVAGEPGEHQQGLMCRAALHDGAGMLFTFQSESILNFWMLNTYIPIDIVYLNAEQSPVNVVKMSPCPRSDGQDDSAWRSECLDRAKDYKSEAPARFALELPSGWLERVGIDLQLIDEVNFEW